MGKIKQFIESERGKDILTILIVILVGIGSFELGRLSKVNNSSGIKIINPQGEVKVSDNPSTTKIISKTASIPKTASAQSATGNFFASTRGSKYYPVNCSAGKTIKQENRIYFNTREEAENAGYELSSSCQ